MCKIWFPGYQIPTHMAIGLNKSELQGSASLLASKSSHLSPPLPLGDAPMTLAYPGKLSEREVLRPVSSVYRRLSVSAYEELIHPAANSFIWADNWFALHSLIESKQKAKLIYLDPPYATGMDFASRDQEHAYNDKLSNTQYIEFMRRRIILLRELLDEAGSLYIHIGHQMVAELKLVLDEVFGPRNFRNLISRKKCSSKNFTKNQYANLNDFVLFYSKSNNYVWNQPQKLADAEWIAKEYTKVDTRGQYKLVPVHAPGVRRGETGKPWRGVEPPLGKHWQYVPEKLDALDAAGEIHWSKNNNPRRKVYLPKDKGVALTDYWGEYRDAHHQSILITGYPTEKNFDMMKMIVGASSNPGDLVIDPFCGSGSLLHAADTLGRKWIGIDQSFLAAKTVLQRLTAGRKPMGDFVVKAPAMPDLFEEDSNLLNERFESSSTQFDLLVDEEIAAQHQQQVLDLATLKG